MDSKQASDHKILLIEDSPSLAAVYQSYLEKDHYNVIMAATGQEAIGIIKEAAPDIVLLDLMLPDMPGMNVLRHVYDNDINTSVIIITAHGSVDFAIEAMRYGAVDFISKPFDAARLRVTMENVLEKRKLENIVSTYQKNFERENFHSFIGSSLAMQTVYRIIESAAPSKATVFVTGESGTGKELSAEAVHLESPRKKKPFVAINCAAIPRDLIESEIFGHVKGAFTGAVNNREGAAKRADGGTLFLDEICEMDLDLQSKLLRFIQTGSFQRVGDSRLETVDVRFVCATNRDPLEEVKAGRFREDLYYRLNVIPVSLPPLRERGDDIMQIAMDMLHRISREEGKTFQRFSPSVRDLFIKYNWPGNVRELENVVRNILVLNNGHEVSFDMIPLHLQKASAPSRTTPENVQQIATEHSPGLVKTTASALTEIKPLWIEEKEIIERAIDLCDGNVPKAAALLEISASTIYRKRQSWDKAQQRVN